MKLVREILGVILLMIWMCGVCMYKVLFANCPRFECPGNLHFDHSFRSEDGLGYMCVEVCDTCGEIAVRYVSHSDLDVIQRGWNQLPMP